MGYDDTLAAEGNHALELHRKDLQLELALEVVRRAAHGGHVTEADLRLADLNELLGDFWCAYGWKERRRLARARDRVLALGKILLEPVTDTWRGDRCKLDEESCKIALSRVGSRDELRAAIRRDCQKRLDARHTRREPPQ